MVKAVVDSYGKLNDGETPSGEYLAAKAEEVEENEPTASTLDRISSKRDSQVESLQTTLDATGHVRVTKTLNKLEMPKNSEAYRRIMKVEAFAWLAMSARFKAKTWLQGLLLEHFVKFTDYILGDKVASLRIPSVSGVDASYERPPWHVVLSYELKLRTEAFKLVVEDGHKPATKASSLAKAKEVKRISRRRLASQQGSSVLIRKEREIKARPTTASNWHLPRQTDDRYVLPLTRKDAPILHAPESTSAECRDASRITRHPSIRIHRKRRRSDGQRSRRSPSPFQSTQWFMLLRGQPGIVILHIICNC